MSQDELRAIIDRATFLHERRSPRWVPAQAVADQHRAQARRARWCQLAAGGDNVRFQQRLAWDALTTKAVLPLLTDGHWAEDTTLPAWATLLADVCTLPPGAADGIPTSGALVEPFLIVAEWRLSQSAGEQLAWLTAQARQQLTTYLKERLIALATPILNYLASGSGFLTVRGGATDCPSMREISQAFPVLARQLATQVGQWVTEVAEFLQRFATDWPLLAAHYGWTAAPAAGVIAVLWPGLSEPHAGGRTVWAVTVAASGCPNATVAYKPKDLHLDWAWNELLAWCNAQGVTPRLDHLWTLPRSGYGWMAWASGEPGVVAHNSERYYQRVGMVLGLLHLLHATDCHAENLLTVGDQLLLVDAEMVRYPQVAGQEAADPLDVLRTGLLPRWVENAQGIAEIGGISNGALSDVMREAIATGYQQIQHCLAQRWQQLAADAGPLAHFQKGAVRFGPRPTAAYLRLLAHLRQPAYLRNGVDFIIAADQLARTYLQHPAHAHCWPLLAQERAAVAQGDVPRFTVPVNQRDLVVGQVRVEAILQWTAPTLPSATVQQQQRQLIIESTARAPYLAPVQPTGGAFLAQALQLGELLVQRAVPLGNDALGWIAPQWQPRSGCWQHALVGDDLYQGRAGIALFLAALYRATGNSDWRDKALAALNSHATTTSLVTGGQLYAYSQCAALLDAPQLDHCLEQFTAQILVDNEATPRMGKTASWGVLDGMAGHLLGLLAVCRQLT
ncbi:MAG TPA: DUF4135 domain-containing protein, partial [Caldilineaceae bacterium]|nr:DUF4135 domain-containing protein [Caldilineaceae bacterium]